LVELRVNSQEKRAEGEAFLQQAQADLKLAQENLERQQQIATAEIEQASTEVKVAQEKYDRDRDLANAGALPQRQMLESQAHLAEGRAQLTKASSRGEVLEAKAQLKRAQAAVEVAQSRIRLSSAVYQTRLSQLGTRANEQGLVTVTAPISGTVADREVTVGQSFQDAGGKLMTIVNDTRVFATANIYEKDLNKVQIGQKVNVKIASLQGRTFAGKIATIGSAVAGETRVVSVKAELDNTDGLLKPGMFAQIEVLTDRTNTAILVVKSSAVVEANGKKLVYIQNGNAYQSAEVILGQTSGDLVEVKNGLFEGDLVVIERANQLYAQSLRGGSKTPEAHNEPSAPAKATDFSVPLWLIIPGAGGVIAITSVAFWLGRRSKNQLVPASTEVSHLPENSLNGSAHGGYLVSTEASSEDESPSWSDNHHVTSQEKDASRQK
jgi:cobalt-zinc-cadmium efflux system membrane fusion protein